MGTRWLVWTALVVSGMVLAPHAWSQATQPAEAEASAPPGPPTDPALRAAFDEAGVKYEVFRNGDLVLKFSSSGEQKVTVSVYVKPKRVRFGDLELRTVFLVLPFTGGAVPESVKDHLLLLNARMPMGAWGIDSVPGDERVALLFKSVVDADASPEQVYRTARYMADMAMRQMGRIGQLVREARGAAVTP
ncbi:MAG: hypothetical protein AAF797_10300 [Planctomycetota bacterium]